MGGIGVSLINGRSEEVAYVSASSCPAIWEVEVKGKWKALSTELAVWMEERWRVGDRGKVFLEDSIEVISLFAAYRGVICKQITVALHLQKTST